MPKRAVAFSAGAAGVLGPRLREERISVNDQLRPCEQNERRGGSRV